MPLILGLPILAAGLIHGYFVTRYNDTYLENERVQRGIPTPTPAEGTTGTLMLAIALGAGALGVMLAGGRRK